MLSVFCCSFNFEIKKILPTSTFQIKGRPRVMLLSFKKENLSILRTHAWSFHKHKCKATYFEIGVYLDVKVNCKFAIMFHTPQNLRHLEMASGFNTGSHTGTKHSKK